MNLFENRAESSPMETAAIVARVAARVGAENQSFLSRRNIFLPLGRMRQNGQGVEYNALLEEMFLRGAAVAVRAIAGEAATALISTWTDDLAAGRHPGSLSADDMRERAKARAARAEASARIDRAQMNIDAAVRAGRNQWAARDSEAAA